MKWQLLSSGAQSNQREGGKGGDGGGRERGPHPGPSAPKSSGSGRWQEQREEAVLGPEGPKLSPLMQPGAVTSWVPSQAAPAPCGGRWQCDAGPLVPPHPFPTFFFHCPAYKGLGGPATPSPTPSPKAQAPWQRPRRQGGVCQRHLSLTSSITGHHGNTHDSTQEGLPVQPSLPPPSIQPQLSPNWKPPSLRDRRRPDSLLKP